MSAEVTAIVTGAAAVVAARMVPEALASTVRVARRAAVRRSRSTPAGGGGAGRTSWLASPIGAMASWTARPAGRLAASRPARRLAARWSARTYEPRLAFALEAAARRLRTGASLLEALEAASGVAGRPVAGDLAAVAARAELVGMRAALAAWVEHRPLPATRLAAAVLAVGFATGGATADALDGVSAALRERASASDEARSLTAQARLSARVLGVAPAAFAVVVSAIDPRVAAFLVATPPGMFLLVSGVVLDLAGAFWMRRLVAGVPV